MDQEVLQLCEELDKELSNSEVSISMWDYTLLGRVIIKLRKLSADLARAERDRVAAETMASMWKQSFTEQVAHNIKMEVERMKENK
jgi:protein subunit release factor A